MAGLTPSQLLVLQILSERGGEVSVGEVSKMTQLKHATITSLVDKLVARGLLSRRVWLTLMPEGQAAITSAPDLLQDTFEHRFDGLPDWHQAMLVSSLERIAAQLDAEDMEAAPILDIGALDERPT